MKSERKSLGQTRASIRHLMMLAELSRCDTIADCADRLFLSKSAITAGLKDIEARLDHRLFDRSSQGISLTPEGQIFSLRCHRAEAYLRRFQKFSLGNKSRRDLHRRLSDSQLRALIEVTRYQNYSLAAHHTGIAQPSLHRSIRELEDLMGQQLFRRSGRGVEATSLARNLSRFANLAYAEIDQGLDELMLESGQKSGRLRIGCLPMARTDLLPQSITDILRDYPGARISVVDGPYDEQLALLLQGELDLIIGALRDPPPTNEITQTPLFNDQLGVVVRSGHPLTTMKSVEQDNLRNLAWIVPREGTPTRAIFDRLLGGQINMESTPPVECSSMVAIRGLLLRSDRAALISIRQMRPDLDLGQVAVLPVCLPNAGRLIGYSARTDWQATPLQKRFVSLLGDRAD